MVEIVESMSRTSTGKVGLRLAYLARRIGTSMSMTLKAFFDRCQAETLAVMNEEVISLTLILHSISVEAEGSRIPWELGYAK